MNSRAFASLTCFAFVFGLSPSADAQKSQVLRQMKLQTRTSVDAIQAAELWIGGAVVVDDGLDQDVSIYGLRTPNDERMPSASSHFEIGSVSKSFTGVLLAWTLVHNPSLDLDDPISNFIPELKEKFAGRITLRQLATHTSGLPSSFCFEAGNQHPAYCFQPADPKNPWQDLKESDVLEFIETYSRADLPPYPREYSNAGFILLGEVLSKINEKSFDQLLTEVITGPLAMQDTFVNSGTLPVSDFLQGFDVAQIPASHWQFGVAAPAGGIISTANDMAKYVRAQLNPPDSELGLSFNISQKQGLGWDSLPGSRFVWKNGETAGFSSMLMFDTVKKIGTLILSNLASAYSADNFEPYVLFGGSVPDVFGMLLPEQKLNSYLGRYTAAGTLDEVQITKPAHFLRLITDKNGPNFRLQASSADEFDLTDSEHYVGYHQISFKFDAQDVLTGFIFHYHLANGTIRDFEFSKTK